MTLFLLAGDALRKVPKLAGIVVRAESGVIAAVGVSSDGPQPNIVTGVGQQVSCQSHIT